MIVIIGFIKLFKKNKIVSVENPIIGIATENEPLVIAPLTKPYSNNAYRFSLNLPEDFIVIEKKSDTGDVLIFNNDKGQGIQIIISPFDNITRFDESIVRASLPDLSISDVQTLNVGKDNTGIAFASDNQAFGGASREVWFVFNSRLYQITTYKNLDPLLKTVFGTWKFF